MSQVHRDIDYFGALWRRKWLVLPFVVVGVLAGAGAFMTMTRVYRASATVTFVQQTISETIYDEPEVGRSRLGYITGRLNSTPLLEAVAEELDLEYASATALRSLAGLASLQQIDPETFVIECIHARPEEAARRANVFARVFVERSRADKYAEIDASISFLTDDVQRRDQELDTASREMADYQAEHKGELPDDRDAHRAEQGFLRTQIDALDIRLESRRKERKQREGVLSGLSPVTAVVLPDTTAPEDPRRVRVQQIQQELGEARLRYTEQHPQVLRLTASLQKLLADIEAHPAPPIGTQGAPSAVAGDAGNSAETGQNTLHQYMRLEIVRFDDEITEMEAKREQNLQRIDVLEAQIQSSYLLGTEMERIQNRIDQLKGQIGGSQTRLQEQARERDVLSRAMDDHYVFKAEASIPLLPFRPDLLQLLAFGIIGGAGLGFGLALLREFMDRSVRTPEEVEELLHVHVLATIPNMDRVHSHNAGGPSGSSRGRAGKVASG